MPTSERALGGHSPPARTRLLCLFSAMTVAAIAGGRRSPALARAQSVEGVSVPCDPDTGGRRALVRGVIRLVTASDSVTVALRTSVGLLPAPSSAVIPVIDTLTCGRAARAVRLAAYGSDTSVLKGVYVVSAGPQRYVAWDPAVRGGEYTMWFVFDTAFQQLGGVAP